MGNKNKIFEIVTISVAVIAGITMYSKTSDDVEEYERKLEEAENKKFKIFKRNK